METSFSKMIKNNGSSMRTWNVDRDGKPFGQIWTFVSRGEEHPFHAKTLDGKYQTHGRLVDAKTYMEHVV